MPPLGSPEGAREGCGETAKGTEREDCERGESLQHRETREMLSGAGKIHSPRPLGDKRHFLRSLGAEQCLPRSGALHGD